MKSIYYLVFFLLFCAFSGGCKKETDDDSSSVFVRLFPSDTSYLTGGAFELPDGNLIVYGFTPEDNGSPPLMIKCDPHGQIIWKKPLLPEFHYCTIRPTSTGTMMAVGVASALSTFINVCEIDTTAGFIIEGTLKEYPVTKVRSGPIIPPKFEMMLSGDLLIATTISLNNDKDLFPFMLHINAAGNVETTKIFFYNVPEANLMTKGLSMNESGFTISGSSFNSNVNTTEEIVAFCLRLNTNYDELWDTILTLPGESIASKGVIETESSIILYGAIKAGTYTVTGINDLIGALYTQEMDLSGNLLDTETRYLNYQNLAHPGEVFKTIDGGFIMSATTNELSDIQLVSDSHIYLLKLDSDLREEWYREFDAFNGFTAVSVCTTQDGGYLIGGYEHTGTFLYNMCLIKTDANGNIVSD